MNKDFKELCINYYECDKEDCDHFGLHDMTIECRPRICDYMGKEAFCTNDLMTALDQNRSYLTEKGKKESVKRRHEFLKRGGLIGKED
jgi:hypothetical protein